MTDYPGAEQRPGQWPEPQGPAGGPPPYGPPPGAPQQGGFPGQPGYPPPGPGYPPPGPGYPPPGSSGPGGPGGFPPGPGGPGYGPYGPPPGRRSKTPWIIGGVAVVAAAAIVVALVLVMGGSKGSSGANGALDKLLNAAKSRDIKTAQSLACPPLSSGLMTSPLAAVTKWKIGDANEQETAATVPFTATAANGEKNYTATAQKQDGKWKICDVQEGGGGGGGGDAAAAQETVQKLLQAGKDRDLTTAKDLTCEPLHSQLESFPEISSFQVGAGSASGSSATVPFTVTSEGKTTSNVADVQQQSGSWKVCDFHSASGGSGGSSGSGVPSSPTDFPTDFPTDVPSGFPTGGGTGSICLTPSGSSPICIPN